jgi:Zn-dependent protease with chaperone function
MTNSSENSQASWSGDRDPKPSFATGLAALKQKDYQMAIAHFEAVCQDTTHQPTWAKAQMGLVKAYEGIGEQKLAIALCQALGESKSQQVRQWADKTLAELARHAPDTASASQLDVTGFVPLTGVVQPQIREPVSLPTSDQTDQIAVLPPELPSLDLPDLKEQEFENPFQLADSELTIAGSIVNSESAASTSKRTRSAQSATSQHTAAQPPMTRPIEWRQAGRAQRWGTLGKTRLEPLWALQAGTAIALLQMVHIVLWTTLSTFNNWLLQTLYSPIDLRRYTVFYEQPFWIVMLLLAALLGLSPWLLDGLLRWFHRLQPLSMAALTHQSPEAGRVLKRVCSQRRCPLPTLGILPTTAPIAITYGSLPRTARIVVSRGLLEQLNDDEITAVLVGELGHIARWDFALMTLVALVVQIPYLVYWQVATWGDRQSNVILRSIAAVVSALGYGLYWLYRWVGLWLSRVRLYYSDRFASEATGNPNGLTRALLKMTLGMATEIQQQGNTNFLLEGFELLIPVSYRAALSLGSVLPYRSTAEALAWEQSNPGRRWLTLNNTHPLLGDRLHLLTLYARHWRLEPEVELPTIRLNAPKSHSLHQPSRSIWLQGSPWFGALAGLAIALSLWGVGALADAMDWFFFTWLRGDPGTLWGCVLMGFSAGIFVRINPFFPDIRSTNVQVDPSLPALLSDVSLLPVDSLPVQLHGKLLGRQGISNWLVQDLMLKTQMGTIKLHYLSQMGAAGNLLLHPHRPDAMVNRSVMVTGWFRRGATPWIDVDRIQPQSGTGIRSGHQLWSTLLACAAALWGALSIAGG